MIHSREFAWRAPRAAGEEPKGRWVGWVRAAEDLIGKAWDWITTTIRKWFETPPPQERVGKDAPVTRRMLETLIVLVIAIIVGAAIVFVARRRAPVVAAEAVTLAAPAVNLADEAVTADQLPESSWLQLADEWLAHGDFRLALRAQYLAALNFLGRSGMVSIRRWKSGLDYQRELDRRARSKPEAGAVFARSVAIFDRGWYGPHPVDREMVETFASDLRELKKHF